MISLGNVPNPFSDWLATLEQMAAEFAKLARLANVPPTVPPTSMNRYTAADVNTESIAAASLAQGLNAGLALPQALSGARYAAQGAANYIVSVNVGGSVTTERDLVSAITQGIYNNQSSGIPITFSTSYK
jgi:hypothetical protein